MAKKVVSIALHKKKPIKHRSKRKILRATFKKILNYMKSDTYMFSPLIYPQSSVTLSAACLGEESCEIIKEKEKKLAQEVEDYLKYDCYMYAPLVLDSAIESARHPQGVLSREKADSGIHRDQMEPRTEQTKRGDGKVLNTFTDIERDKNYTPTRRIAIKHTHTLMQQEKVIVHQNSSVPEKSVVAERGR